VNNSALVELQAAYWKNLTRFSFLHQQNRKLLEQRLSVILQDAYYATFWCYAQPFYWR